MPWHEHSVPATGGQHRFEGGGPSLQVRIGVDDRITGLLDEITAEHHRVPVRHCDYQVVAGVASAGTADAHRPVTEVEIAAGHRVRWHRQRRDRLIDFVDIGPVSYRVCAQMRATGCQGIDNLWCAEDLGVFEP